MAIINLLPNSAKKERSSIIPKRPSALKLPKISKSKPAAMLPIAVILLLLISWLTLTLQAKNKEKTIALLDKRLLDAKSNYQEIENLNGVKKELSGKLLFYQGFSENNVIWSEKLLLIGNALPAQVWLTNIYTESKPGRILIIRGSSASLIESEMIASISQFVERLKMEASFHKDFSEIKLGPLLSEKKGSLNVMSFSLFCKLK